MSKSEEKDLVINPIFEPLFSDNINDPRYYQVYGGRGSGKSFTVAISAVTKTYSKFQHRILYLRQTMSTSGDSTIADVKLAIEKLGVQADFRESKGMITNIRTGSTISFKGIKATGTQTAKLKSLSGITTLIIEEAEEVESFEEFSKIDESIRILGKPLKVILVYNPTSSVGSWIHEEWFHEGQPKPEKFKNTVYLHSTYLDNIENLNPSIVERYRDLERTNLTYYVNTILAEWTLNVSGQIYAGWGHYDFFEEDEGDTWYGLDFSYGGKDHTACVKVTWFDEVYYIEEMFSEPGIGTKATLTKMRECGIPFTARIYADSAMPLLMDGIKKGGYTSIRPARKGEVEPLIKIMQDKPIIVVGSKKSKLYHHYLTFRRDKKGKLPHEPDILAATRYAILSRKPIKNPKRVPPRRARKRKGYL